MIKVYKNSIGGNLQISKFFSLKEIVCSCGKCNITLIDSELLLLMDAVRGSWHLPLTPTSVYRCQAHNSSLDNSSRYSLHQSGGACDFPLPAIGADEFIAICEAIAPFTYHTDTFIHIGLKNS